MELKYAQLDEFIEHVLPFHLDLRNLYPQTWKSFKKSEIEHLQNGIKWLNQLGGAYSFMYVLDKNKIVCSCLVGFTNSLIIDKLPSGFIGYFDALENDLEAVELMLSAAEYFLVKHKFQQILAPFDFSIWQRYRFMDKGFEKQAFVGEPRNHKYYSNYFLKCNFKHFHAWNNYKIDLEEAKNIVSEAQKQMELFDRMGYKRVFVTAANVSQCLKNAYQLFTEVYKMFPGYQHIEESNFCETYAGIERILHLKSSFLVENKAGETVAGIFVLKDVFEALKWMNGRANLLSKFKFLLKQNSGNRAFIYQGAAQIRASKVAAVEGRKLFNEPLSIGRAGFAFSLQALLTDKKINEIQMVLTRPEAANVNYVNKSQEMVSTYSLFNKIL